MKKILTIIILSSISAVTLAEMVYNKPIPQIDRVTNNDFDGDGILDSDDSTPFGLPSGQSTTETFIASQGAFISNGDLNGDTRIGGASKNNPGYSDAGSINVDFTYDGQSYSVCSIAGWQRGDNFYIGLCDSTGAITPRAFYDNFSFTINNETIVGSDLANNLSAGLAFSANSVIASAIWDSYDNNTEYTLTVTEIVAPTIPGVSSSTFIGNGLIYANGTFVGATKNHPTYSDVGSINLNISYNGENYYVCLLGTYGSYTYIAICDSNGSFVARPFFNNFNFNINGDIILGTSLAGSLSNGNAYILNSTTSSAIWDSYNNGTSYTFSVIEL
jgi:hypothetical protein